MYKSKSILAVVPARGGSKGVPLKNLHPLGGIPLIAHTGNLVKQLAILDRTVVSTDHEKIASAARSCGIDAPFFRPVELSGDRIGDTEVLIHALIEMERIDNKKYDVVVMLQPTCPLRRAQHVHDAVAKLVDEGRDSVWTVSPTEIKYHPLKQLVVAGDGEMSLFDPKGKVIIARQQLQPTYTRNGAAYALSRQCLLEQKTTLGQNSGAIITDEILISIDTLEDFEIIEKEISSQNLS